MLFFLGLPLLEIAVLIQVGQAIGFWPTLGLLVLSGGRRDDRHSPAGPVHGRAHVRRHERGTLRLTSIVDSYTKIVAGCLLIVPGFITDALGLALLVPPVRRLILGAVLPGIARRRLDDPRSSPRRPTDAGRPIVIEGTYERLDDERETKALRRSRPPSIVAARRAAC